MANGMADLEGAIHNARLAAETVPSSQHDPAAKFHNLSELLGSRYDSLGNVEDLSAAIKWSTKAVEETPLGNHHQAERLGHLSSLLSSQYDRFEVLADLDESIRIGYQAVEAAPLDDPSRAMYLSNMSINLESKYARTQVVEDLEEAISVGREACNAIKSNDSKEAAIRSNLSNVLGSRFKRTRRLEHLDETIHASEDALKTIAASDPNQILIWMNLSVWIGLKYKRTGRIEDLEKAICIAQRAVDAIAHEHPSRAKILGILGAWLGSRYQRLGNVEDLNEAVRIEKEAVNATPQNHPNRGERLNNLSIWLGVRFERLRSYEDLELAIQTGQECLKLTSHDIPVYSGRLVTLGNRLYSRYKITGSIPDLEHAISSAEEAIQHFPRAEMDQPALLANLGKFLDARHQRIGRVEDQERAISAIREAIEGTQSDDPTRIGMISNLAVFLKSKYARMGILDDLDEAISRMEQVIGLTPKNHAERPGRLSNFSTCLGLRYKRTHLLEDLEEGIRFGREAVLTSSHDNPNRPRFLHNLSMQLRSRYERNGFLADLENAINFGRTSLSIAVEDQTEFPSMLNNLALSLNCQYLCNAQLSILEEAICTGRQAIKATPLDHPNLVMYLNNISTNLALKFEKLGLLGDLEEAITIAERATQAAPENHPDRAACLLNLGDRLYSKYTISKDPNDLQRASVSYVASTQIFGSLPLTTILAGRRAGLCFALKSEWTQAFEAFEAALKQLSKVTPRSIARDDQQYIISQLSGLSSLAGSAALQANLSPSEALTNIEAGRGIVSGLIMKSRSDVSDLKEKKPLLFEKYEELRDALSESFADYTELASISDSSDPLEVFEGADRASHNIIIANQTATVSRHRQILLELEKVEDQIRKVDGMESFQFPESQTSLIALSESGPIISFNVTQFRSDAFLATDTGIRALPLPNLTLNDLKAKVGLLTGPGQITSGPDSTIHERNSELRKMLKWLWKVAVRPVLEDLGLLTPHGTKRLPRVWWVTSGLVGLFPLHAAGYNWGRTIENTASCVVSSYTPTIKALLYAKEKGSKSPDWQEQQALIVTMPKTTGWPDLDVLEEVPIIQERILMCGIRKVVTLDTPSRNAVLRGLQESSIVHFACHAESQIHDPSSSGIFLKDGSDGKPEQLTARDLSATSLEEAQMAFISACSTAKNSALDLLDEAIHVASAFQLIGFPHVIGTYWEVDDDVARETAQLFYAELAKQIKTFRHGEKQDAFAYALHDTIAILRDGKGEGLRRKRNASDNVVSWAPFIHMGC